MFKKELKVTSQHLLSKKDKKKITQVLKTQNYQKASLHHLLNQEFTIAKLSGSAIPDKVRLISSEGNPIFLEVSGTQKLFYVPTVYTIMEYPSLIPQVVTNTGVRKFILNGADLMWPGVHNPNQLTSSKVKAGDNVSIKIYSQGSCEITATGILMTPYSQEMPLKGRAVAIWNTIGDKLWTLGCKKILAPKYNISEEQSIHPGQEYKSEQQDICDEGDKLKQHRENIVTGDGIIQEKKSIEIDGQEQEQKSLNSHSQDQTVESVISPQEMDDIIMTATLNSFKLSLKDNSHLPIEPSAFKSQHLIPCSTMPLEFSSSSYKKLGRYLTHLHKIQLIYYDDPKGKNHPMITKIYHQNELIKNHQPTIKKPKKRRMTVQIQLDSAQDPSVIFAGYPRVTFREEYKLSKVLSSIYNSLTQKQPSKQFFSIPDCKAILLKYIQKEGLDQKAASKKDILLDPLMAQFVQAKGRYSCSKAEVFQKQDFTHSRIKDNITLYHFVEEIGNPAYNPKLAKPKLGSPPVVKITMKSVANKKITLIQGLYNYKVDEPAVARYLQKKCSGASSAGENEIKLQGATHVSIIQEVLTQFLKIPQKSIEFVNLIKPKKKKAK